MKWIFLLYTQKKREKNEKQPKFKWFMINDEQKTFRM